MKNEIWKDIHGYEGYYQVSNIGKVKSLDRFVNGNGGSTYCRKGKMMVPCLNVDGYYCISFSKNAHIKTFKVHSLVAETFIYNHPDGKEINHKNGIKSDNRIANLEWVTASENVKHSYNIGLKKRPIGENNSRAKLIESQIIEIRKLKNKKTHIEIAELFGVSRSTISQILRNESWNHLL